MKDYDCLKKLCSHFAEEGLYYEISPNTIKIYDKNKVGFIRFDFTDLGNFVNAHIGAQESNFIKYLNRRPK